MDFKVFICYKRDTAKDFAEHLKKGLGNTAFLDIKDIPKACSGTEKWSDSVNEAIKKTKIIVIILTVGCDASTEIKRELSLARKTGNKQFVYFRHKEFDINTTLTLEDGPLNLGDVEQVQFDTKEELLRKAHKVIKKTLKVAPKAKKVAPKEAAPKVKQGFKVISKPKHVSHPLGKKPSRARAFEKFKAILDYAYSSTGLNMSKTGARKYAENWIDEFAGKDFEKFKEILDYAYSSTGLNMSKTGARKYAENWILKE